ncbi:MAG TPA: 30S ribosomal protein S3 [Candidatus Lokiarchaeia archaeon]|nr:30S ribosomal protein S3 [Candidatus Lokiarchaeia archaeon]
MPATKKLFAVKAREQLEIKEFFSQNLEGVGFAGIDIQKTPIGTRVTIKAARPGLVIGKKGSNVKSLTEVLARDFKIENPQIDVDEVKNPELNAQIMAERLASALEKGQHYRRAGYGLLRRIMRAGAEGCEIVITGKLTSQRSRYVKMHQGNIKRCGDPVRQVSHGCAHAKLKSGVQGVRISILPIGYDNPKEVVYLGTDKLSPEFKERVTSKEVITTPIPIAAAPKEAPLEEEPVIGGDIEEMKPSIEVISKIKGKLPGTEDVLEEDSEAAIEDEDIEVDLDKDMDADAEKKEPIDEEEKLDVDDAPKEKLAEDTDEPKDEVKDEDN